MGLGSQKKLVTLTPAQTRVIRSHGGPKRQKGRGHTACIAALRGAGMCYLISSRSLYYEIGCGGPGSERGW